MPANLPASVLDTCAEVAMTVHSALGLSYWSRSDLIVDADGRVWFLEVNVAPGMTETSTYPQAVAAAGLQMGSIVEDLVSIAIEGR